jgi:hypothetical protein
MLSLPRGGTELVNLRHFYFLLFCLLLGRGSPDNFSPESFPFDMASLREYFEVLETFLLLYQFECLLMI